MSLHFVWIGARLPWAYAFAALSAVERSGIADITLHHTDALDDTSPTRALLAEPRLRLQRLDPLAYLARAGETLGVGEGLARLYARLDEAVMRADVLRAAILFLEGGVYLDLDTITVAPLAPLMTALPFVGSERIVWPRSARRSRSPVVRARHASLDALRTLCRLAPRGWALFRHVEGAYVRSVNNAVMGAEPHCRFVASYLRGMLAVDDPGRESRYALGPHLLADIVRQDPTVTVHPPQTFYPLAPEISEHWFRMARTVRLDRVLSDETRVVHWYASVRTRQLLPRITPDYVVRHRHRQLYSALVWSVIGRSLPGDGLRGA